MTTSSRRPHVLIIEDELISGLAIQMQLADLGFCSFAFAGAELQAVEQAHLRCPDLVTVDLGLLDGNGLDAADTIVRACGPTPVVFITGDPRRAPDDGVVVEKPVSLHALAKAVELAHAEPMRPAAQRAVVHRPVI